MSVTVLSSLSQKHLKSSSWNFRTAKTSTRTHGLHPYPARMVPRLARELIRRHSKVGDVVYDPFAGSGTTLVEASVLGRHSVGVDANPFAVLLSKVKTTPIHPRLLATEWDALRRRVTTTNARDRDAEAPAVEAGFLDLSYWYKPFVVRDLSYLRTVIELFYPRGTDPVGDFFRLAFARTVRAVSNQRPTEFKRWRRLPEELKLFRPDPIGAFVANVERALPLMSTYYRARKPWVTSRIFHQDSRRFKLLSPANLIVTSPPYGDSRTTIPYGQYSSFALEWLGMHDIRPDSLDREPMGADSEQFGRSIRLSSSLLAMQRRIKRTDEFRTAEMVQFFDGLCDAMGNMQASVTPGGACCMVVGNRRVCGVEVPTDAIISEIAEKKGFETREVFYREIRNKVMPLSITPTGRMKRGDSAQATMNSETILILQRR